MFTKIISSLIALNVSLTSLLASTPQVKAEIYDPKNIEELATDIKFSTYLQTLNYYLKKDNNIFSALDDVAKVTPAVIYCNELRNKVPEKEIYIRLYQQAVKIAGTTDKNDHIFKEVLNFDGWVLTIAPKIICPDVTHN
jgi:hypothetical protein